MSSKWKIIFALFLFLAIFIFVSGVKAQENQLGNSRLHYFFGSVNQLLTQLSSVVDRLSKAIEQLFTPAGTDPGTVLPQTPQQPPIAYEDNCYLYGYPQFATEPVLATLYWRAKNPPLVSCLLACTFNGVPFNYPLFNVPIIDPFYDVNFNTPPLYSGSHPCTLACSPLPGDPANFCQSNDVIYVLGGALPPLRLLHLRPRRLHHQAVADAGPSISVVPLIVLLGKEPPENASLSLFLLHQGLR